MRLASLVYEVNSRTVRAEERKKEKERKMWGGAEENRDRQADRQGREGWTGEEERGGEEMSTKGGG